MKLQWHQPALVLALSGVFPAVAVAQSNDAVQKEMQALKARIEALEKRLKDTEGKLPPAGAQWGMTPEQAAELNRVVVKTEAMEDGRDEAGFKGLKISGYIDPVFIYNRRQDRAGFQFLNSIGDGGFNYDNSFFGMAYLDLQKETESGTRWRLTLAPQRGVGAGIDSPSIVHEASVSIPLGSPTTRLLAGQVPDWSGYEYLPATQTKLITHNLLFDYTLPFTYTGIGMERTQGKWIFKGMAANMNASKRRSGNKKPVVAYRIDYARGEYAGFGLAGVHGKAANFRAIGEINPVTLNPYSDRDTRLDLFEVDAYFVRGDLTVQGQVSFGRQKAAAITADPISGELRNARWAGISALAAYKLSPRFEGVVRLDHLRGKKNGGGFLGYSFADDLNGIGPDLFGDPEVGAHRTALSVGFNYLYDENTVLKAEYRLDRASLPVFLDVKTGTYRKSNSLLGASVIVSF
jgi:hypothetical protein